MGPSVPAVAGPAFSDEASDDDNGVGVGDERVDHDGANFCADGEFSEPAVVPGVRSRDRPSADGLQWGGLAFRSDLPVTSELVQQLPRVRGVVAGVDMHGDVLRKLGEPVQFLQRRSQ